MSFLRAARLLLTDPILLFEELPRGTVTTRTLAFPIVCTLIGALMGALLSPAFDVTHGLVVPLVATLPAVVIVSVLVHAIARTIGGIAAFADSVAIVCYASFGAMFREVQLPVFRGLAVGCMIVIVATGINVVHRVKRWKAYLAVLVALTAVALVGYLGLQRA